MPDKKDQEFVSFADAHDDWVRKNTPSLWRRFRGTWIFPPAGSSLLNQVLGYVWRILLLALSSILVSELLVRSHLKSKAFADLIAEETRTLLKAEEVQCDPLRWKNRLAFVVSMRAAGSGESFFDSIQAEGIHFSVPWAMTHRDAWRLGTISILEFDADLDADPVPASAETEAAAPTSREAAPPDPVRPRFGIHPRFDQLEFDVIETDNGTFRWGSEPFTTGSLRNARMNLSRAGSGIVMNITSGVLSQNWLRDLRLSTLEVRHEPGTVRIERCEFSLGEAGTGTARGTIITGEVPEVGFSAELDSVQLGDLLPEKYSDYFTGTVNASLKITGSTVTVEGIVCEGTVNLAGGLIRNLQAFETLTSIYADSRFRRLKIDEGTVSFTTKQGVLEITDFDLRAESFIRLKGRLRVDDEKELFTGRLDLGIDPRALEKYPEIAEKYFPGNEDGFRWVNTDLQGSIKDLTSELSFALATKVREINLNQKNRAPTGN